MADRLDPSLQVFATRKQLEGPFMDMGGADEMVEIEGT